MSGFAVGYFQDPSLLQFQERLKSQEGRDNLNTIFTVEQTPSTSQLCAILDTTDREIFRPIYQTVVRRLQRGKHLEQYRLPDGTYLVPIDGTQYFSSNAISCTHCLTKEHKSGEISYSHATLQGAIVHPEMKQVIPLMPEEIRNTDGTTKQDCEISAAKRFLEHFRADFPHLPVTIGGDSLNSKQPMIEAIRDKKMNFILVAKPGDHVALFKEFEAQKSPLLKGVVSLRNETPDNYVHYYEWINDTSLNGSENSINVNFVHYQMKFLNKDEVEEERYVNSWVTDSTVSKENVQQIVQAGRCRWKIENECFNCLKNQG